MKNTTFALIIAASITAVALTLPISGCAQDSYGPGVMTSVGLAVNYGPPPLPYYPQPYAPGPGYMWVPGYWAYGVYGYYWVPGTWVLAPAVGMLWTPGWWGWDPDDRYYHWHPGYWGRRVGYYGGIDYGHGYYGRGYDGGYWHDGDFYYNRRANRVDPDYIHHFYDGRIAEHGYRDRQRERVSYNGGVGGIRAVETHNERVFAREHHDYATAAQWQHQRMAHDNPAQRFSVNHGRPQIAATARPARFNGAGVVRMNRQRNVYEYRRAPRNQVRRPAGRPPMMQSFGSRTLEQRPAQRQYEARPMQSPPPVESQGRYRPPSRPEFRPQQRPVERYAPSHQYRPMRQPEMRSQHRAAPPPIRHETMRSNQKDKHPPPRHRY